MKNVAKAKIANEKELQKVALDRKKLDEEMKEYFRRENMSFKEKSDEAKDFHKIKNDKSFNMAFAGHTKTGKSSLINAIRGIKNYDAKAAKVGITETTRYSEKYSYSQHKNFTINLFDIPGSGTQTHESGKYYQ
uniref:IRG-type G domain-containing protein n=1 Tax=Panagrolaimus davidi TaxID=227884 RepID=A0A914QW86_9BILA